MKKQRKLLTRVRRAETSQNLKRALKIFDLSMEEYSKGVNATNIPQITTTNHTYVVEN